MDLQFIDKFLTCVPNFRTTNFRKSTRDIVNLSFDESVSETFRLRIRLDGLVRRLKVNVVS